MKELEINEKKDANMKDNVADLYEMMKKSDIDELEVKDKDSYIYIKRKGAEVDGEHVPQYRPAQTAKSAPKVKQQSQNVAPQKPSEDSLKSPISGVFYQSPSPSTPPFVSPGDVIDAGKTLCIVEAMKVMNEVKAESRIKIVKILVENGKIVSSGQDLFIIEKQ
jgi:acetyl-CoA carboxylase biotin carboxyl carrier protein